MWEASLVYKNMVFLIRALGIMVITMFVNVGITSSNGLAMITLNDNGWKVYSVIMALPAIIPFVILLFLPESPKYLNVRNRREQVVTSLRFDCI